MEKICPVTAEEVDGCVYLTLSTKNTSYQMYADEYKNLIHLYYGKKTIGPVQNILFYRDRGFSPNLYDTGSRRTYSMDTLPLEYPVRGNGDFRSPCLDVNYPDTSWGCDLRFDSYKINEGKYSLPELPAAHAENESACTLEIVLRDGVKNFTVTLLYGVLPETDIITRAVKFSNTSADEITLRKIQSACLDFITGDWDLYKFYGRHAMERITERTPIGHSSQVITSRRGTSSHQMNPSMIIAEKNANENYGSCYGMTFVYSGSFKGEAERSQINHTRAQLGMSDEMFAYPVKPGEDFYAPEVILTYSSEGLNRLSQNFHRCIRRNICRGKFKDTVRPVLINSWEASYFNINFETITALAKEASEVGIELLVMDDGWFGKRNDDNSGLGDWTVNEKKMGCTLKQLADKVNECGLKFGIWFEPEMVNEDSDFYRAHPDYALNFKDRKPIRSRFQLVLDFSRKEVVDAVFEQMCKVIDSANIEYIKWDMNRSIADVYSPHAENQGKVLHDYVKGLYSLLDRLTAKYPDILLEGCSGGGGRFDAGMLYYEPQIWCSDNTDAIDRTIIQHGTSYVFPPATMGSHVSAVPNHQNSRVTPLNTRGIVAMAGSFGYELNLGRLSEEEKQEIKKQVEDFRKVGELIQKGIYYRLTNPVEDDLAAWENISEDSSEILVSAVLLKAYGYMTDSYIRLKGLRPQSFYRIEESGKIYSSEILSEIGLPFDAELKQFNGKSWRLSLMK